MTSRHHRHRTRGGIGTLHRGGGGGTRGSAATLHHVAIVVVVVVMEVEVSREAA